MTKLTEDIYEAISVAVGGVDAANQKRAMVAAEVCKGYIDRAVKDLIDRNTTGHPIIGKALKKQYQKDYENWLKSEGITSTDMCICTIECLGCNHKDAQCKKLIGFS